MGEAVFLGARVRIPVTIDEASAALSEIRSTLLVIGSSSDSEEPHFMIANWATQASFDPWRFLVMLKNSSHTLAFVKRRRAFTVNLLDESKRDLVRELQKARGNGHASDKGSVDAPRLPESFAGIDCKLLDVVDVGGDHALVVADVVEGWKRGDGPALTLGELRLSYAG